MHKKPLIALALSLTIALSLAAPVSAYFFEFDYFETDKLVYEVGESIDMVAKLIADFSGNGWCYVSFAVVTDHGSVFTDEFFIQPSTDTRYITSSYLLAPNDTSPGVLGTEAFVIFNVEIYDTYSEGGSETITINITRGRLMTTSLTPLNVEGDTNTTVGFKVASIHNENVTYDNEPAIVTIRDSNQNLVHESNTTVNNNGEVFFEWSPA
ncbi:MAG: hypothetical protein ACW98Y_22240, partial [Candidatus Thorarchaeota archaeon]